MKRWQCSVCKYIHKGDEPPEKCPVCGVDSSKFILLEDEEKKPESAAAPAEKAAEPSPEKVPTSGVPEPETSQANLSEQPPVPAGTFYDKAADQMVKHHAHPVTVHMPNGIIPVVVALFIISWLSGATLFAKAGFINLFFVVLSLPVVLFSGYLEWTKKYGKAATSIFKIKIMAAAITTSACMVSIIWYLVNPDVLTSDRAWVFILVNLVMLGAAGVAGHIGGKLVFKD